MIYEIQKMYENTGDSLDKTVSGVVIGSETCIYSALNPRWFEDHMTDDTTFIRYLTPMIPEGYIEKTYAYIKALCSDNRIKVTFNDYGLLYRCKELILSEAIIPVLGRVLTRSMIDCPWYHFILKNENDELKDATVGTTSNHESKWYIWNDYLIREIEVNMIQDNSFKYLKEKNIQITAHAENTLLSVSKTCFTARCRGVPIPECCKQRLCDRKIEIDLKKKWCKGFYVDNLNFHESLLIYGNSVFKKSMKYEEDMDAFFDILII